MKKILKILIISIFLINCSNPKRNLIVVENDYEINLTKLDSVRENMNGFWILENELDKENLLWLNFDKEKNFSWFDEIPYTEEIKRTEIFPVTNSVPLGGLIKINDSIQIEIGSLSGIDTLKIEYLSKTRLRMNGITYLKHKGYEFLK